MFTQTKAGADGVFDRALEEVGGSANAMTYYDFTAYHDDLPPSELALVTRLEADRMLSLDLNRKQVETERDVVVEERPRPWKTASTACSTSDVQAGLSNASVPLAGDRPDEGHPGGDARKSGGVLPPLLRSQQRRAGDCGRHRRDGGAGPGGAGVRPTARGPCPFPRCPRPEQAPAAVVETTVVRPVPADRFVVGFASPALGDPDRAAYEIANEILTGGPSSRLHRALIVDKEWASSVHGDIAPTRDPGLYAIWVQMTKGHEAREALPLIVEAAADLAAHPVAADELAKAAARLETAFWSDLGSSHGRADALGQFEIATGDFRRLFERGREYPRVTPADVQRVAARYLAEGRRSVVVARPKAKGEP